MAEPAYTDVRPSPIAGQWYPGSPERLASTVDRMLEQVPQTAVDGEIIGVLAPHAGYHYSGLIAARAFRLLRGFAVDRVVVISPMHHIYPDPVLTTGHQAYETPLGLIAVDQQALDTLRQQVPVTPVRRDPEHSLEIELPFLQRVLDAPFRLLPLMLRDQTYPTAERLGLALAAVIQDGVRTLLVASSDLSHFYDDAEARYLDQIMLDRVAAFDPRGVIQAEEEGRAFACGRAAIAAMLIAAREAGADQVRIVGYGTSADAGSDPRRVVGYGAAVVCRTH